MNTLNHRICRHALRNALALAAALACFTVVADDRDKNNDGKISRKDKSFVEEAVKGGIEEVKMGQLGADKASNPQLKQFAERLVKDHNKANEELKQLAGQKGIPVEAEGDHMHKDHNKLSKKTGAEFDKAFVEHMMKDHKKDIRKFEEAARDCDDAEIKAFAQKTLPTLRQHLQQAQTVAGALGVEVAERDRETGDSAAARDDSLGRSQQGDDAITQENRATTERGIDLDRDDDAAGGAPDAARDTGTSATQQRDAKDAKDTAKDGKKAQKLSLSDLPAAVQNTVKTEQGGMEVESIQCDTKDGKTVYKVEFRKEGKNVDLHIAEDGSIVKDNRE